MIKRQKSLDWQNEWIEMPEFIQNKQKPYAQIIVRFNNENDLQEFSKLINQRLTSKTKSIWHPQLIRGLFSDKRWIDTEQDTEQDTELVTGEV